MKIKVMLTVAAVAYASLATARESAPYPNERLVSFVVEKLDVTSLPSMYRLKKEKGKKTLEDYGYATEKLGEKEALVEASGVAHKLSIKILQKEATGIYVCMAEPVQDGGKPKVQSVILLKRKDPNALLKGRTSWKEFASCPAIGGDDNSTANAYGGD